MAWNPDFIRFKERLDRLYRTIQQQPSGLEKARFLNHYRNTVEQRWDYLPTVCKTKSELSLCDTLDMRKPASYLIIPQYRWNKHTFDIAVIRYSSILLFIECDGNSHHEWEQVYKDRSQETLAASSGIPVLRFSNNRIKHNVDRCCDIVFENCLVVLYGSRDCMQRAEQVEDHYVRFS